MDSKIISYDPLWEILRERNLPKCWLCKTDKPHHITTRTLAKLSKNQSVTTDTLIKVCSALDVNIADVCTLYKPGELGSEIDLSNLPNLEG